MEDYTGCEELCRAVERETGRTLSAASDFNWLSEQIQERTHELLSPSTLMRLWGYRTGGSPRKSSLDIVARYLGHADFAAFRKSVGGDGTEADDDAGQIRGARFADGERHGSQRHLLYIIIMLLLVILGAEAYRLWHSPAEAATDRTYILKKGDYFPDCGAYLRLFGITEPGAHPWSQPLPHHDGIVIFGGQYGHPHWGNEGSAEI